MKTIFPALLALVLGSLVAVIPNARAQGTQFSYQAQLTMGGAPANGSYDLQFGLWSAASGPSQLGSTLTFPATLVSNGLISVTLDFGTHFPGADRWVEIAVRTNGDAGAFTALAPRRALSPTPYAIHAGSASDVVNGAVVKSLNNLRDNVTLAAGANVTLTPSGNTLTIASGGGGGSSPWSLNGASAYYNAGNVGVGTPSPQAKLDVRGNGDFYSNNNPVTEVGAIRLRRSDSPNRYLYMGYASGNYGYIQSVENGVVARSLVLQPLDGNVGIGTATPSTKLHVNGAVTIDGNVGIGTATPSTKLHVNGEATMTACNLTSDRNAKEEFQPVSARDILEKVASLDISEWQYKTQPGVRHIGPVAQDFHAAFATGRDDKHIATVDADGVALAAIQGLNEKLEETRTENAELKQTVEELRKLVTQLARQQNGGGQ